MGNGVDFVRPNGATISLLITRGGVEKKIHPTQKPVALYTWLLSTYAKPGDSIIDTHSGSLSIALAAHDLGFEVTAIEIDPEYYQAARKRLVKYQLQQKLF